MTFTLSDDPVPEAPELNSGEWGADVVFLGRVRGSEDGRPISGIDYSAYPEMALRVMEQIAAEMEAAHGPHPVRIHHRTGFVPTGEPSILIATGARHSAEAMALCAEYLRRIKAEVPIWKRVVFS
ncbi:MAG TPA: molybdenum cofactor biosynthesis protein MoaE [Verrucomicrobiales bacterium]|nr:molybdenum cofactor biosynthesis protein MoaE [Verrucomicrobiales bacterium]